MPKQSGKEPWGRSPHGWLLSTTHPKCDSISAATHRLGEPYRDAKACPVRLDSLSASPKAANPVVPVAAI